MKAKVTLVFKKLDRHSESTIADDIMAAAPDTLFENVHVMKTIYLMKVRFSGHQFANKIKERGVSSLTSSYPHGRLIRTLHAT